MALDLWRRAAPDMEKSQSKLQFSYRFVGGEMESIQKRTAMGHGRAALTLALLAWGAYAECHHATVLLGIVVLLRTLPPDREAPRALVPPNESGAMEDQREVTHRP